jgi:hypothetical protein
LAPVHSVVPPPAVPALPALVPPVPPLGTPAMPAVEVSPPVALLPPCPATALMPAAPACGVPDDEKSGPPHADAIAPQTTPVPSKRKSKRMLHIIPAALRDSQRLTACQRLPASGY